MLFGVRGTQLIIQCFTTSCTVLGMGLYCLLIDSGFQGPQSLYQNRRDNRNRSQLFYSYQVSMLFLRLSENRGGDLYIEIGI